MESIIICPKCDGLTSSGRRKAKCYLNEDKGLFYCHQCNAAGKIEELGIDLKTVDKLLVEEKVLDKDYWSSLKNNSFPPKAREYLIKRLGEGQRALDLSQARWDDEEEAIAFPSFRDQTLISVKLRFLNGSQDFRWKALKGSEIGQFNVKTSERSSLLIVEGQFDALAASLAGFKGTVWALESTSMRSSNLEAFRAFKEVFLMLDSDDPGKEGSEAIKGQLPKAKILSIPSPYKDYAEFYEAERATAGEWMLKSTKPRQAELTSSLDQNALNEWISYANDNKRYHGWSTGWKACDAYFKIRPSEFTVVNSFAKMGKTTFTINLSVNLMKQGAKVAIASFEMKLNEELYPLLMSTYLGKNVDSMSPAEKEGLLPLVKSISDNVRVYKGLKERKFEQIESWVSYLKEDGFEPDILLIDHIGFMLDKPSDPNENSNLAASLATLAQSSNKLAVIAVVQAPKPPRKDGQLLKVIDLYSGFGGAAWGQYANLYLSVLRYEDEQGNYQDALKIQPVAGRNRRNLYAKEPVILSYDWQTGLLSDGF